MSNWNNYKKPETVQGSVRVTNRMTIEQRKHMLACLLADESLFNTAKTKLKPELFNGIDEIAFKVIWSTAVKLAEAYGHTILFGERGQAWNAMDTEGKTFFQSRGDLYPIAYWDDAFGEEGFLTWFYGQCKPDEFNAKYGERLLSNFLQERSVSDTMQKLGEMATAGVITNVRDIAQELANTEQEIDIIGVDPVQSGAPDGWLPPETLRKPTTVSWLDESLCGGHRSGETYFVAGAVGSGKTTFSLQMAQGVSANEIFLASGDPLAQAALHATGWDTDKPYDLGHVYYFHYEMSTDDIRTKLWSSAALIHLAKVAALGRKGASLSDTVETNKDEREMLQAAISQMQPGAHKSVVDIRWDDFPSERIRLDMAKKRIATNLWMIDCSGTVPGLGKGYIPEIASILSSEVKKGRRVACVVIDYASACVYRHSDDERKHYSLLSRFGHEVEHMIAQAFSTPVWIMQQLSGAANLRTAASKQHHADAKGCKSMGDACCFAFNICTSDEKTGCKYFTQSKARYAQQAPAKILRIAGGYNRLIDVSSQYSFDRRGNIVPKDVVAAAKKTMATPTGGSSNHLVL